MGVSYTVQLICCGWREQLADYTHRACIVISIVYRRSQCLSARVVIIKYNQAWQTQLQLINLMIVRAPIGFVLVIAVVSVDYNVTNTYQNLSHIVLNLQYTSASDYYKKQTSPIYKKLNFTVACHSFSDLSFTITDPGNTRFRVPQTKPFITDPLARSTFPLNLSSFAVTYTASPFNFKIVRRSTNEVLFDTSAGDIVFSAYYLEISTRTLSKNAWGFGERFTNRFRLLTGKYTIFNRDRGQTIDNQQGYQTHGHQPIYFIREASTNYHVNLFRNPNAMDIIVTNDTSDGSNSNDKYIFTYKTIGGIIDFRFVLGDANPQTTIQRFHIYLGRSAVPLFWSLGFHQCRWGYNNVSDLETVAAKYKSNDIPLDTIWSDIDYMLEYEDFVVDQQRFNLTRMQNLLKDLHYIPIVEPGIKVKGTTYDEGVKRNVFLKDAVGNEYRGKVWPSTTTFVDFFHPNATQYWIDMLGLLYDQVKFSGVWLDMNQIANLCNGTCQTPDNTNFDFSNDLPYNPGSDGIQSQTVSLNSTHYNNLIEADVHAYFGFLETYATHQFLVGKNMRPFIISRSTAPGHGNYGFHWTGDNFANYDFLRNSIAGNFLFQIWGVQMVGADICAFGGNTTQELCARWFQLGSFYPFSRNHNEFYANSQQAYALGDNVIMASRTNLKIRYSILKNYFRNFVAKRGLGTIFRPLFFSFYNDIQTLIDDVMETQFMIGQELMFAPVLQQGVTSRVVYFPENWYDFYSGQFINGTKDHKKTIQNNFTDAVPLFIREGHGVFVQNTTRVTKTSQLNDRFDFKAGLRLFANSSSDLVKRYSTRAFLLGIKDYNDEAKLSLCIYQGCQYDMVWNLQVYTNGTRTLDIQTLYVGGLRLNETQFIDSASFYLSGGVIVHSFSPALQISRSGKQSFTFESSTLIEQEERQVSLINKGIALSFTSTPVTL